MLIALLFSCVTSTSSENAVDTASAMLGSTQLGECAVSDYRGCVTDAECSPGSWCTSVPGHTGAYCAPPCDPAEDGSECPGDPSQTLCLDNGRCAWACSDDTLAETDSETGTLLPHPDDTCPVGLECTLTTVGDADRPVCAGSLAGASGNYGICSHPLVEGTDCPEASTCFGGSIIGAPDDLGICLPWCDDGTCPAPPPGSTASPLCYDIGFDHPLCLLLCTPGDTACPTGQVCEDIGVAGLCIPEGVELGY